MSDSVFDGIDSDITLNSNQIIEKEEDVEDNSIDAEIQ